jgi:hypothetical protein
MCGKPAEQVYPELEFEPGYKYSRWNKRKWKKHIVERNK